MKQVVPLNETVRWFFRNGSLVGEEGLFSLQGRGKSLFQPAFYAGCFHFPSLYIVLTWTGFLTIGVIGDVTATELYHIAI